MKLNSVYTKTQIHITYLKCNINKVNTQHTALKVPYKSEDNSRTDSLASSFDNLTYDLYEELAEVTKILLLKKYSLMLNKIKCSDTVSAKI